MRKTFVVFFVLLAILSIASPVLACHPEPPQPPRKDCSSIGKSSLYGFQINGAANGTYYLTSQYGKFLNGAAADPNNYIKIYNSNGRTFSYKSSIGIDYVIINAAQKSVTWVMNDENKGYSNIYGPKNSRGSVYTVSNVIFCYDYNLTVKTSAKGMSAGSAAVWQITKNVDVLQQAKFAGESANFNYTVAVDKTAGSATGFQVVSQVTVKNETPVKATVSSVKNKLVAWDPDIYPQLDCGSIQFPFDLQPGSEFTCTATTSVPSKRTGEITANVYTSGKVLGAYTKSNNTWDDTSSGGGIVGGPVTVTDTNAAFGGPFTVSDDQSWTYTVSLACPTDPAAYVNGEYKTTLNNTAAIVETAQQASQAVQLTCYAPTTALTTNTTYDAKYNWAIAKTSSVETLKLNQYATAPVQYDVDVTVASTDVSNFQFSGAVQVNNPNPAAPMTVTLSENVLPGIPVTFTDCVNPLTIPAGQSLTCNYTAAAAAKPAGNNTVQVTLNGIVFATATPYDFSNAVINEVDECVTVTDSALTDPLGTVCASAAPAKYTYNLVLGPYDNCGPTAFPNMAAFVTNDTATEGYVNHQLPITVRCLNANCVFTVKYWIDSSNVNDPSTYNHTWDLVGGPNTGFYDTEYTWLSALQADASSSAYLQLAQTYIAVRLSVISGAQPTEAVSAALNSGDALMAIYATDQANVTADPTFNYAATLATLNEYLAGDTGPGICPECLE